MLIFRTPPPDPTPAAQRIVVSDGAAITLALYRADETLAEIVLGPADAVRVASELLRAALRRFGRLSEAEMAADSMGSYDVALRAVRERAG